MSVVEAVERDLAKLPGDLASSGLAASALALAAEIDGKNSATSKSMCAKTLLDTLDRIRALTPPAEEDDRVDELRRAREKRIARMPAAAN